MEKDRRFKKVILVLFLIMIVSVHLCLSSPSHAAQPIKVGCSVALSGLAAKSGGWMEKGYRVWADEVNQSGGLLGRPIELIVYDDESNPARAVKLFEKLITNDKIDIAFSPYSSDVCLAASTVTERYKMPTVSNGASPQIYQRGYKYIFGIFPPLETMGEGALELAKEKGYKKLALINQDTLYPKSFTASTSELAKKMGFEVVLHEQYPPTVSDLSAVIGKLKNASPEIIIGGCRFPDGSLFMRQARELGLYAPIFAIYVASPEPEWFKMLGDTGNYVMGESVWEDFLPSEANKKFLERFYKLFGEKWRKEGNIDYHLAQGYVQGKLMEFAIRKVGAIDNEKIRDVLTTTKIKNILIGDFKVQPNGYQDPIEGQKWGVMQWINGKKEIVWPKEYRTHDPIIPFPKWEERKK